MITDDCLGMFYLNASIQVMKVGGFEITVPSATRYCISEKACDANTEHYTLLHAIYQR